MDMLVSIPDSHASFKYGLMDGKKEKRILEKEEAECHLPRELRLLLASSEKRERVLQPLSYFKLQFSVEDGGEKGDTKTVTRHVQLYKSRTRTVSFCNQNLFVNNGLYPP
jgi:hypothetical protein